MSVSSIAKSSSGSATSLTVTRIFMIDTPSFDL